MPVRAFLAAAATVAVSLCCWPPSLAAQSGVGTIRGRVRLAAPPPVNPPIRMGADPACSALNGATRPVQEFVVVNADGGLANAFVHLLGAFPSTPVPTAPVTLNQQGCVYRPHVIGIKVGQTLQVSNTDPTLHNIHSLSSHGNDFNVSRPARTPPFVVTMNAEEMMVRITCDVHAWMNIFVGVVSHPYFSVTGADGTFEIPNVPAGRHPIQVWHERYGPLDAVAEVSAGTTSVVDFTYTGTEKAAAPTVRTVIAPERFTLARFDQ
jgi:plastocyanin